MVDEVRKKYATKVIGGVISIPVAKKRILGSKNGFRRFIRRRSQDLDPKSKNELNEWSQKSIDQNFRYEAQKWNLKCIK